MNIVNSSIPRRAQSKFKIMVFQSPTYASDPLEAAELTSRPIYWPAPLCLWQIEGIPLIFQDGLRRFWFPEEDSLPLRAFLPS